MRLYNWLCEPVPAWFDRGMLVAMSIGFILGNIIERSIS